MTPTRLSVSQMLSKEEAELIISSLTYDTQGNWGDGSGRQEKINSLILKLLREFNVQRNLTPVGK